MAEAPEASENALVVVEIYDVVQQHLQGRTARVGHGLEAVLRGDYRGRILDWIHEHHSELDNLYRDIYTKKDRTYWSELDTDLRRFCAEKGFLYVRNDDTVRAKHGEPPVVVNYFYHEEIVPSARKEHLRQTRICC